MKKTILLVSTIVFLVACTTMKNAELSQQDVDKVKPLYPNYTLAELNQGKSLYGEKCALCHSLKSPTSETPAKWKKIVREMTEMANEKAMTIDPIQEEMILRYLVTMTTPAK
jgi:cytochrome c5